MANIDITAAIATRNEDGEANITCKRLERERKDQGEEVIHLSMRKSDFDAGDEPAPASPPAPSLETMHR